MSSDKTSNAICENESIVFTALPAGQANYEFFIDGVSKQSGAANTFTTTEINQDRPVRVVIRNAAGCEDDETINVSVARNTTPGTIQIDTDGDSQGDAITHSICDVTGQPLIDGTAPGGAVATSSDQVIYRWAFSTNGGATFVPIAGQTGSDLAAGTVNITQTTIIRRTSYATITGTNLLCDPRSDEVTLTVTDRTLTLNAAETSGVEDDNEICSGDTITFTAAGNQAGDTIQWLVDGIAPAGALTDPGNVITYPETALVSGQQVSFRITTNAGSGSCVFESTPITVIVTDLPLATLSSNATGNTMCGGINGRVPFADSVTFTAGPPGQTNYTFLIDGVARQTGAANTFVTDDFSVNDADLTYQVSVQIENASGCLDTEAITMQLNYVLADPIVITGGAVSANICYGTALGTQLITPLPEVEDAPDGLNDFTDGADYPNGGAITYEWQDKIATGPWTPINGATARNYTPPIIFETTQYKRISRSTLNGQVCENESNIITINVAAELTGGEVERNTDVALNTWVNLTETVCEGDTPQLLRVVNDTAGPGIDYQWQFSFDNTSWQDVTIANNFPSDATGIQYQPEAITSADISSRYTYAITGFAANQANDFYRVTIGTDVFTVLVGEVFDAAAVGSGVSPVDSVDEVLALLEYKINQSGSGITAVDSAAADNIVITLAPGSVLIPTFLINDGGADVTGANSNSTLSYNGQGSTRFYRRGMTQNFGGSILPLCQTFSDVHTVEINTIISGKVSNTDLVICHNTQPSEFTSERDAYSTNIGANIVYQWYRTTDVAQTNWIQIVNANSNNLNFGTALTQTTSFKRRATSTYNGAVCFSETDPIQIRVLDQVNTGFVLADQNICRVAGVPLTVNQADLVNIVANAVEPDDGPADGISYQWQFSADNANWDDVTAAARPDLLTGGFAANLNGTAITAAQLKTDIERRLSFLIDPDISTTIYYRLKTTRFDDDGDNTLEAGEVSCEVLSGVTQIDISAQPTLVQTTAPLGQQIVCNGDAIDPITFRYGGSATGITLVNLPGGLASAVDNVAKTITITGIPTGTGFVRVETNGTVCETQRLNHQVRVTFGPQIPDYILIDDAAGGTAPIPIITGQDGNIYNGQVYLCEAALNTGPANSIFSACYNDGRDALLTSSFNWYIAPPNAGVIDPLTGVADWDDGFFGDATISVEAIGCDGTPTARLNTVVTVNQFDSAAAQPTEPVPLLQAQTYDVLIRENGGFIRSQEQFNVTLNGVRYTFETTDTDIPADGIANQNSLVIAQALRDLINNDTTSPVAGLFSATAEPFGVGDANLNGLNDDTGGRLIITAQYDGYSAPLIPPGSPRGYGGNMDITYSVTPSSVAGRAFGLMTDGWIANRPESSTSELICGDLTGAEPICETTATTPNTQYFSSASNYASIRFAIANVVPDAGSVALPGVIDASTGILNWNAGFHGSFSVESYATGCDGIENPNPGVHTARIYETLAAPSDISYDPLTLPDCPAVSGDTTQFTSSTQVTWSWNNELAGSINSVTGLVTWANGWSGTVVITATSFGCGGQSLSRTVVIPDSPVLTRTSALFTTNQSTCIGSNISSIRYEISGSANGADVTGINDLNLFEQLTSTNQIDRFNINTAFADAGDQYTLTIDQVPYTVAIGEDAVPAGGAGVVDLLEEVVQVFVYKINQANLGITAVNDGAAGQFTLTSNAFDYSVNTSLNDVAGNEAAITFSRTVVQDGGTFIEISGTVDPALAITQPTTYQYTITSTGGNCAPSNAQGFITVSPNSTIAIQAGMDNNQTICNNVGAVTPIVYDLVNASTVNVVWTPSRPAGVDHTHVIQNQISTITLGGINADVAANNGLDYTVTINGTTLTYTVNIGAPQNDNEISDILNGLRTLIINADLQVDPVVTGGDTLRITSRNGNSFTITETDPDVNDAVFSVAGPATAQTAINTVTIFGSPTITGLAVDTAFNFTINTVNNAFGCNDPAVQDSESGIITVALQPAISLTPGRGSNDLRVCSGESIFTTQGGTDIEYDITGYALGASIPQAQLPPGVQSSFTEIPQITQITFAGNEANFDDTDVYRITVNGVVNDVSVDVGVNTFATILQAFETSIDTNVPQVDASYAANTLTIQSNTGDNVTIVVTNVGPIDVGDPTLNAPDVTQANRKFIRIYGTPTGAAAIYNYTISTFGSNCTPVSLNGVIRVVDTPTIAIAAGSNAFPNTICNLSPMTDIVFDVSSFATYSVNWTGANGTPPGIILARTTPTSVALISDPVVNVPGLLPDGGLQYPYSITSTVNDNGCSTVAQFDGVVTIVNGTATLALDDASSLQADQVNVDGGAYDPSVAPDYVLIEACQGSVLDNVLFSSSVDITNVTIAAGGNLPSGLFADFTPGVAGGNFEIYGTPDTATTEDLVLQAVTDACVPAADIRVRIVVFPSSTITLDAGSDDNQVICNNTPLANISYTVGGALDASVAGLPNGLVGNFEAPNKFIISGTPNVNITETTQYNYTITTTNNPGGTIVTPALASCAETTITGVVTVRPNESLTVSPAPSGATIQSVCYGENITPIVISVVGDNTFASVVNAAANLPVGMNFDFVEDANNMGGIVTISGSPSAAIVGNNPKTYSFTVTTDGVNTSLCADAIQQIDITVTPASTLSFSGANPAVLNQTVCEGTLITDIEFAIGGGARDVIVNFDPGLGFNQNNNVRVNDPTDPASTGSIYGTAPAVVNRTTYNFEIITVNQCIPNVGSGFNLTETSLAGTITVIPQESITRRVASGSTSQEVCVGAPITPIIYDVTGQDTFVSFVNPASVPSGISLDFAPDQINGNGGVLTISGRPDSTNAPRDYTFQVSTGGANTSLCDNDTEEITVTLNALPTMVFSGADPKVLNQILCTDVDIDPIQYTYGGSADNARIFSINPAGLTLSLNNDPNTNTFTLSGRTPIVANETTYTYIVETENPNGCSPNIQLAGTISVFPPVQYVDWTNNHAVSNPLCNNEQGSIIVQEAAVSGGFVAVKQQSRIQIDNNFQRGDVITINIGPQTFSHQVRGLDANDNPTNVIANIVRVESRHEIMSEIEDLINDSNSGSTLTTALLDSPAYADITLTARSSGVGFNLTSTKVPLASPGAITLTTLVQNQSLTYEYYWMQSDINGAKSTLNPLDATTFVGTGLTFQTNVSGTEYFYLRTRSNGCESDSPIVTLTEPTALELVAEEVCNNSITIRGSGGTGQYTYSIYDKNNNLRGISTQANGVGHTFTNGDPNRINEGGSILIEEGEIYRIGIVDENNCSLRGNDSKIEVETPRELLIDENKFTITPAGCNSDDGSIVINGAAVTGGSAGNIGDYTNIRFQWYKVGGGFTDPGNVQSIYNLSPGEYYFTVEDLACGILNALSNNFTIIDNGSFTVLDSPANKLNSNCSDGIIQVSIDPTDPGSGNFSYAWTDQFGVSRGTTNRIENLDAGIYTLVVRDTRSSCEQTFTYTITGSSGPLQMINPLAVNQANFSTTDILCSGAANGAFTVEFTGGNPPYQYSLNGGAYLTNGFTTTTAFVTTGGASSTVVSYTTQVLSLNSLEGGTYSVKIKDSGLCTDSGGNLIELNLGSVTINEPDPLSIGLNATTTQEIDCSAGIQGSLGVNITGGTVSGTTPYSILWELYGPSGEVLYKRTTSGSPSDPDDLTITGLDYAGDYTVTVTDAAGCFISEVITLEDGSNEDPLTVGETPIITQPGCNSDELGGIELELSGGVQPYDIKWYKLAAASDNALSLTSSGTGTGSSTLASSTLVFSDGGYVSMNKDGFYLIDNLEPGKYRAIVTDATGCQIFSRSGIIKTSSFNMVKQKVFNREVLDCESGIVEADFSFRLTGTSLAYNIFLDGELVYGGSPSGSSSITVVSPTFASSIIKSGSSFIIRGLSEGRHIVEAQDSTNTNCSLDYAFDIETYVPITFEGETEFEFDVCENGFPFELDTTNIIGGNPIIDDNDNVIYNLRWTYTPSDPNQPGSSFVGRTSFEAGRGTYQLIISDGTCESEPIDFVFSGDVNVLSIGGLLSDANGSLTPVQGVSCELGARDGRISIDIVGGQEPYDISWEIFDASNPRLTPVSSTISGTTNQVSPWRPLDGSYPGLDNFDGFSTLNELPAGLYRYTIRSGSTCPNPIDTPFNYLRDVISVDDDTTLVITDGPFVDYKLCEGLPGLIILDAVNNSETNSALNFFYIDTNGTEDIGDDGQPVALNGNTTKLDEDTYQILIDAPFEYGKIVITTDQGCGVEAEFNLALGDPFFSYTSPSFEQVNEIPAREDVTFRDESEGEFSRLEWNFGDNSESIILDVSGTSSGVTQVNHSYGNSGTYYPTLTIYNEIGCFESVTNPITIGRGYSIYVPNVFTPNNDCLNDYFRPLFTGFESLIFNVFDNRGNLIYSEEAQDGSIDRSDCPDSIDSFGNGKSILGWDGNGFDGLTMDAFSPYFVYTIYAVPLNRVTPDQTIERSGIFTILK